MPSAGDASETSDVRLRAEGVPRHPHGDRIDVDPVADDARHHGIVGEDRPDRSRRSMVERSHRIEEMGGVRESGPSGGSEVVGCHGGVAAGHDDSAAREPLDHFESPRHLRARASPARRRPTRSTRRVPPHRASRRERERARRGDRREIIGPSKCKPIGSAPEVRTVRAPQCLDLLRAAGTPGS